MRSPRHLATHSSKSRRRDTCKTIGDVEIEEPVEVQGDTEAKVESNTWYTNDF